MTAYAVLMRISQKRSHGVHCLPVGILPAISVFFVRRFVDEPALLSTCSAATEAVRKPGRVSSRYSRPSLWRTTVAQRRCSPWATQGGYSCDS